MASGLITRGMVTEGFVAQSGSGGAGLRKVDDIIFPKIIVNRFKVNEYIDKELTEDKLKVRSVKIIID